jgi:hypothetical protein
VGGLVLGGGADAAQVEAFTDRAADAVSSMTETCALDLAERDAMDPGDVGTVLGVTRQRINQIERRLVPIVRRRVIARGVR